MNESPQKTDGAAVSAASGVPGVPVGSPPAKPVAQGPAASQDSGLAGGKDPAKKPFGGNAGRKTRADGLKPGSTEALAADRAADAKRKRDDREARRLAAPPPPLPSGPPPSLESVSVQGDAPVGALAGGEGDPVLLWTSEDFRQCAVELVELAEAWRVDCHTKQAGAGKLPAPVVQEIARGATFPAGSKKSLSTSSPVTLAKMFNSLRVPLVVKSIISTAPALAYIIVRDFQTSARIEKLIAEQKQHTAKPEAATA
jgi:hypothetical protein